MSKEVRVRFAPSPTGALHIGGVRTALYNYLFAKKMGGKMILRIEDTDQTRFVSNAEAYIQEALAWVGIKIDEGVAEGGPSAPYRQSERKPMYKEYAMKLVNEGNAYYAFDTPEELEAMKERLKAAKVVAPAYNAITRTQMKNSLTLPDDEVKRLLASGVPYVIRLKVPRKDEIRLNDIVRGWVMVHSSAIDDKVLMKSDGMPTYHLANVVDDHLMGITHVIRGEEWLPSAPLHVLLYKFLGWEDTMPQFAHLPLILNPDGEGKLSKRKAALYGFPVVPLRWTEANGDVVMSYKEEGYLPEAVVNFLAFLGWNPGTNQELFTMEQLIEAFSLERIGKAGTKFDINKAKWYNQQYIKQKSASEISKFLVADLEQNAISYDNTKVEKITELLKERIVFPKDLWKEGKFFFIAPDSYEEAVASAKWTNEAVKIITAYKDELAKNELVTADLAKSLLNEVLDKNGVKMGKVLQALRLAITGVGAGPDLMHIIELLGKEEVSKRLTNALVKLDHKVIA